ncbi:aminomethyl transferase family protein [Halobellus captivus]|uniref:aminomethyl transferase family protein n=1 Tax=Halobellus captivus TaxID=2592614 RepID=UPI00119CBDFB|nr:aminomethyl transferase family protein [Halobellus captivus]
MAKPNSLEEILQSVESPVERFRSLDIGGEYMDIGDGFIWSYPDDPYEFPDEYTNWIEEQRSWRETCALADQSYHMEEVYLEGPDSLQLLSDLGVNSFEDFRSGEPGQAKQLVMCNPDGELIGDTVLFYVDEEKFLSVSNPFPQHWLQYNLETGDYNATIDRIYSPYDDSSPEHFRFEVQGPEMYSIMEEVIDGSLPEIGFFNLNKVKINGKEFWALGHGMAGAPGVEVFGPYTYHDEIKDVILDAGQEYGLRQLGSQSYKTATLETGWIGRPVPAIYDSDDLEEYRKWLSAETLEANLSFGGSFDSDTISDYYFDPIELGYDRLIDFDHDFIGKEALEEKIDDPNREKVTLVLDHEDIIKIYSSLFEGDMYKFMPLPDPFDRWDSAHHDKVTQNGSTVGIARWLGYTANERKFLALGVVDADYSKPGTEVSYVWGEPNSKKSRVERHEQTTIDATVASTPYVADGKDV